MRPSSFIRTVVVLVTLALLSACGQTAVPASKPASGPATSPASKQVGGPPAAQATAANTPEAVAIQAFQTSATTPYSDVQANAVKNDGTFATVDVSMKMRERAEAPWVDSIARYELSKVGDVWRVIPITPSYAAFANGTGSEAMAALIQAQPQRRRTRGGSASSSSRKAWTSATLSSRVA